MTDSEKKCFQNGVIIGMAQKGAIKASNSDPIEKYDAGWKFIDIDLEIADSRVTT